VAQVLAVDPRRCTGCRTCELVCSHAKTGQFRPTQSAIRRVTVLDDLGFQPWCCLQCTDAECVQVCPVQAIRRTPEGWLEVDPDSCIGCSLCSLVCPFGNIRVIEGYATKCDLCGGDPLCVRWCPRNALAVDEAANLAEAKAAASAAAYRKLIADQRGGCGVKRVQ